MSLDALDETVRKAGPTAGPPRQGLLWKPETHRWIRPPNPSRMRAGYLDQHARKLAEQARIARQHMEQARTLRERQAAQHAHRNLRSHRQAVRREIAQRGRQEGTVNKEGQALITGLVALKKEVQEPFAVATATAQEMGYSDFSEGSPGREKRDDIAETLKEESKMLKERTEVLAGLNRLKEAGCH